MAKVLVVDDSSLARRIVRSIAEGAGHQVLEASDGTAALEQYALERPEVVMLDLNMTGMHGLEVLGKLRELDPGVRVIVSTADVQNSTRLMAEQAGSFGFIQKPFAVRQVIEAIDAVLRGEHHGTDR